MGYKNAQQPRSPFCLCNFNILDKYLQVWFKGIVTGVTDTALFTFYSLRYTDDGKIEDDVDENDLRLCLSVANCSDDNDKQAITNTAMLEDGVEEQEQEEEEECPRACPVSVFYSADDLSLLSPTPPVMHSEEQSPSALLTPGAHPLSLARRRRWSFESSPAPSPPAAVTAAAGTRSAAALQQERQQRFDTEDPGFFIPLAARCANPACRRLTCYRCERCNQSYSCSVACQKQVSLALCTLLCALYSAPSADVDMAVRRPLPAYACSVCVCVCVSLCVCVCVCVGLTLLLCPVLSLFLSTLSICPSVRPAHLSDCLCCAVLCCCVTAALSRCGMRGTDNSASSSPSPRSSPRLLRSRL